MGFIIERRNSCCDRVSFFRGGGVSSIRTVSEQRKTDSEQNFAPGCELRFGTPVNIGMGRKPLALQLPPLPKAPRWKDAENKTKRLLGILRQVARKNQKAAPRPFYPLREVAAHFGVAVSAAANCYGRLEQEGLLNRIRSSHTVLVGKSSLRALKVRGVVAVPASVSSLVGSQDYRTFVNRMRRSLRGRGFIAEVPHYEEQDLRGGEIVDRIKRHQTDTVIWFMPERASREVIARLRDAGIRVVGISDGGLPPIACSCQVRRRTATRQLLKSWRESGAVESIAAVTPPSRCGAADEERLESLLKEEGWDFKFTALSLREPARLLETVVKGGQTGVVLSATAASLLSFRAPELLVSLLKKCRVGFVDGPVRLPFGSFPREARVDLIHVNWKEVARQITDRLLKQPGKAEKNPLIFQAEARLRVTASAYAQRT